MATSEVSGGRSAHISEVLYREILDGTLRVGVLLPAQRELAARFGVSMASVRSALGSLAAIGMIETIPGKGSIVRSMKSAKPQFDSWMGIADSAEEMLDLLEARLVLERFHIEKASAALTPEQAVRLRSAASELAACVDDVEAFKRADYDFHLALAEAGANGVTVRMLNAVRAPMQKTLHLTSQGYLTEHGDLQETIDAHTALIEAVVAGDAATATALLEGMIERSRATVLARM